MKTFKAINLFKSDHPFAHSRELKGNYFKFFKILYNSIVSKHKCGGNPNSKPFELFKLLESVKGVSVLRLILVKTLG